MKDMILVTGKVSSSAKTVIFYVNSAQIPSKRPSVLNNFPIKTNACSIHLYCLKQIPSPEHYPSHF